MARDFDILIAGGGLAGAAMAALLAARPATAALKIGVIEPQVPAEVAPGGDFDARVVAVTEASRRLLDEVGAWPLLAEQRVCPYYRMEVRDSEGTGCLTFDCSQVHAPNLGHIVENRLIVAALQERLAASANVEWLCPAAIDGIDAAEPAAGLTVTLKDGRTLDAGLVIAADGARSRVRELCGLPLRRWQTGQTAIVATIETEQGHGFTARQWFMRTGPLAFLPLVTEDGDSHFCSIVWSQDSDEAERLRALADDDFLTELTRASESTLGRVTGISSRFAFPLGQQHAGDYGLPGIALIGDAAHTIHPLAGQGANLGFADAAVLAEEIERAVQRRLSLGDASLPRRYQRRRQPENLAVLAAMAGFQKLFAQQHPLLRLVRNSGMSGIDGMTPVKRQLIRRAMGL